MNLRWNAIRSRFGSFKYSIFQVVTSAKKKLSTSVLALHIESAKLRRDALLWLIEAIVEGFILNFGLHAIFKLEFGIVTILGYGFLAKFAQDYTIEFWERWHGTTSKVLNKHDDTRK